MRSIDGIRGDALARTNIEEESHRRVTKLSQLVPCSDREALGTVGYLWTESQDILATGGDAEQILEWAHLFGLNAEQTSRWLTSLEKARFISKQSDGTFKIHGNASQIDNRVKAIKRAQKGAEATRRKWAKIKLEEGLEHSTSEPEEDSLRLNPRQSNPRQSKAISEWAIMAIKVRDALERFNPWLDSGHESEIIEMLGEELYRVAVRAKPHVLRQIPNNGFYLKTVEEHLRIAAELLAQEAKEGA